MQHKLPRISEINLQLVDFGFYFSEKFESKNVEINLSVKPSFRDDNFVVFFIHIRYSYKDRKGVKHSLYHTDYLSFIEINEVEWQGQSTVQVPKTFLAHLLGMSILLVRGAISQRLSANILSTITIPVMNPTELLERTLQTIEDQFILELQFAHTEEE